MYIYKKQKRQAAKYSLKVSRVWFLGFDTDGTSDAST